MAHTFPSAFFPGLLEVCWFCATHLVAFQRSVSFFGMLPMAPDKILKKGAEEK